MTDKERFKDWPSTDRWTTVYDGDPNVYVECPECRSKIRLDARRCRHCASDVSQDFAVWSEAYTVLRAREQAQARLKAAVALAILSAVALWVMFGL